MPFPSSCFVVRISLQKMTTMQKTKGGIILFMKGKNRAHEVLDLIHQLLGKMEANHQLHAELNLGRLK